MGKLIDRFKEKASEGSFSTSRITKAGCSIKKNNLPKPYIFIDLDQCKKVSDSRCADYVYVSDFSAGWIVLIEMKKGSPNVVTSAQQLQATAKLIRQWTKGLNGFTFIPLLVSGRMDKYERRELDKSKKSNSL